MDNLKINSRDLALVLKAIYGKELIKKMHLLKKVETRSNKNGIYASELAVVLISDMVKSRQKKEKLMEKPRINFAEFCPSKELLRKEEESSVKKKTLVFEEKNDRFIDNMDNSFSLSPTKKRKTQSERKPKKKRHKELLV
jgi:hypothetical protein